MSNPFRAGDTVERTNGYDHGFHTRGTLAVVATTIGGELHFAGDPTVYSYRNYELVTPAKPSNPFITEKTVSTVAGQKNVGDFNVVVSQGMVLLGRIGAFQVNLRGGMLQDLIDTLTLARDAVADSEY